MGPVLLQHPVNWSHPLTRGLTSLWIALPELSRGLIYHDLCGRNHGTLNSLSNLTWHQSGRRRGGWRSLETAGSGYVSVTSNASLQPGTGDFTIGCWARYTTTGAGGLLFAKTPGAGGTGYDILMGRASITGMVTWRVDTGPTNQVDSLASVWNDGLWHFYVGTRISGTAYFYIDAMLQGSVSAAGDLNHGNPLNFFGRNDIANFVAGYGDGFLYYNTRGISAADVREWYELGRARYPGILNRYQPKTWFVPTAATGNRRRRVLLTGGR